MLIIVLAAAAVAVMASAGWSVFRLWQAVPRRNTDLVLF